MMDCLSCSFQGMYSPQKLETAISGDIADPAGIDVHWYPESYLSKKPLCLDDGAYPKQPPSSLVESDISPFAKPHGTSFRGRLSVNISGVFL